MKARIIFKWYDFWVGFFWDRHKKMLYIFPVPMLGIRLAFNKEEDRMSSYDTPDTVEPKESDTWKDFEKRYR